MTPEEFDHKIQRMEVRRDRTLILIICASSAVIAIAWKFLTER